MATSFAIGQLENTSIKLQQSIKELTSRISQCEIQISHLNQSLFGIRGSSNQLIDLRNSIDYLTEDFNAIRNQLTGEICELRAQVDALSVEPNQKTDLEIFDQKVGYIDLDNIREDEKGFWELYDENWWNK